MRHYEIIFLVNPDQSAQIDGMIERYKEMVQSSGGHLHRLEDWGRRTLAYPIKKIPKAHYILMNVECDDATRTAIEEIFRYNDAVLRHLILRKDEAITEASPILKSLKKKSEQKKAQADKKAKETAKKEKQASSEKQEPTKKEEASASETEEGES